jgi:hypothetical protein
MSSAADVAALVVASAVVMLPGVALLLALGVRRPLWWVALGPAASVGVATVTAMACATTDVRYGPLALGAVTGLLAVVGALRWHVAGLPALGSAASGAKWLPGTALVAAGVGLGVLVWTHGLGSMATVGQEHDLIVHGVLAAYIQQSGHGAPWQLLPADVLTGRSITFYPAGIHLLMAATAALTGSTVVGINAVSAVVLGAGWTSGSGALAHVAARRARLDPALALVAAGTAAIVAAGLYRPTIALAQWGGTIPNAATLALTPGLLAALLTLVSARDELLARRSRRVPVGPAVGVGVAIAGMLAIHPSAVVTVSVSAAAWWTGEALGAEGRRRLVDSVLPLLVAGVVAVAIAAPMLLAMSRVAAHIGAFRPDIDPIPLGDALDRTLRLTYNAGDPRQKLASAQTVAGVLAVVGAAVLAASRRAPGAVAAWLAWVVIVTATWVQPGQGLQGKLTGVFYDAQMRVWSHASLFVPTVVGVGLAVGAALVDERVRRTVRVGWPRGAAVAAGGVLAVAYLLGPGYRYSRTDVEALASRYARPEYTRVSGADRRAGAWLADQVGPGERVLNSANDGSTSLYVDRRVPIVNVASLGSAAEPATYRLLQGFNRYPVDPEVRRMLRDLDVRWVYVDTSAPTVSASGAPYAWAGRWLSVPEGLQHLDGLPGLERRYRSGTVSIYHLDPAAIAEPAEPAEPPSPAEPAGPAPIGSGEGSPSS